MIWWIDNPTRSASERLAVESLAGSQSWMQIVQFRLDGTRVCWDIDIVTPRRSYPITLRYPDFFPGSPPLIFPRGLKERWSFHQYGAGGELCLEIGPDNWDEAYTGADMLKSAYRLLTGEEEHASGGPDVDSRHKESLGQLVRTSKNRIFIPTEANSLIAELLDFEILSASVNVMYRKGSRTFVVASIGEGDTGWKASIPPPLLSSTFSLTTTILRWPTSVALPNSDDVASFRTEFQSLDVDLSNCECLIVIQGSDILAFDLVLSAGVGRLAVIVEPAASSRLDKDHSGLATRKVAIAGCGSMGSKIATTLARSGVGEFILVDDDIFLPENLVRNDLDWRDVTLHKVDALADKLGYVQPGTQCKRYRRSLGGQESSANIENLIEVLANCDLIVDATADVGCFSYLGSLAKMAKRPMIWGEVFAGGFGGFVARHRPAFDPNPMTMRHMMLQWCETQGQSVLSPAGRYESGDENPAIADDAEVGVIASHMALLALDTLLPRNPTAYPYGIYVIGLRAGWVFDQPFEVRPIDVGAAGSQHEAQATIEEKEAEIEEILELLSSGPNANTSAH
jgi:sulfur-carrier protein adenylyltransferase/sulfurtransferase